MSRDFTCTRKTSFQVFDFVTRKLDPRCLLSFEDRNTNKEGVRLVLYNNLVNQIEKVMSVIKWV